jgi:hypothetical protein
MRGTQFENVKKVIRDIDSKLIGATNDIIFTGLAVQLDDSRTLSDYCAKTLMFVEVSPKSKDYWHERLGCGSLSGPTQLCLVENDFTVDATRNSAVVVAKTADVSFNFNYHLQCLTFSLYCLFTFHSNTLRTNKREKSN